MIAKMKQPTILDLTVATSLSKGFHNALSVNDGFIWIMFTKHLLKCNNEWALMLC